MDSIIFRSAFSDTTLLGSNWIVQEPEHSLCFSWQQLQMSFRQHLVFQKLLFCVSGANSRIWEHFHDQCAQIKTVSPTFPYRQTSPSPGRRALCSCQYQLDQFGQHCIHLYWGLTSKERTSCFVFVKQTERGTGGGRVGSEVTTVCAATCWTTAAVSQQAPSRETKKGPDSIICPFSHSLKRRLIFSLIYRWDTTGLTNVTQTKNTAHDAFDVFTPESISETSAHYRVKAEWRRASKTKYYVVDVWPTFKTMTAAAFCDANQQPF